MSINICLTCCDAPMLGVYILTIVTSSFLDHYVISLSLSTFIFKSGLIWILLLQLSFNFHLHGMSFSILLLSVCTSLELKCVSSRQHIYRSSFCIHLASLCLLIRAINPFQFNSVAQLCPTLCNPMNRITPGLPVHHQLPSSTQTHVHWVSDAIQPSHPLLSSSPASNPFQH